MRPHITRQNANAQRSIRRWICAGWRIARPNALRIIAVGLRYKFHWKIRIIQAEKRTRSKSRILWCLFNCALIFRNGLLHAPRIFENTCQVARQFRPIRSQRKTAPTSFDSSKRITNRRTSQDHVQISARIVWIYFDRLAQLIYRFRGTTIIHKRIGIIISIRRHVRCSGNRSAQVMNCLRYFSSFHQQHSKYLHSIQVIWLAFDQQSH